jgi:hypothetical protein
MANERGRPAGGRKTEHFGEGCRSFAKQTSINCLNLHLIPEPSALAVLALPLLAFAFHLRRRKPSFFTIRRKESYVTS